MIYELILFAVLLVFPAISAVFGLIMMVRNYQFYFNPHRGVIPMKQKLIALAALAATSTGAIAALPAGVTDAITTAGTDAATAIAAIIVVGVAIWALNRVRKLFP